MNFTIKIAAAILLIFLGTTSSAQNIASENQEKVIKVEGNTSNLMKTSNYVLNIKVKRKSNTQKIVVTSMEYVEKQFKLHQILEAQKRRISKINRNKRKS